MRCWQGLLLLMLLGCKGHKSLHEVTIDKQNKTVWVEQKVKLDTIKIPADTVMLTVPVSVLMTDTVIQLKGNVATSTITINEGQFTAMAVCDSLERMVVSYQQQTTILKQQLSKKNIHESTVRKPKRGAYPFFAGLLIGAILVIGMRLVLRSLIL